MLCNEMTIIDRLENHKKSLFIQHEPNAAHTEF